MGRSARRKQERLAEKLLQIRLALGLSQNGMLDHLGLTDDLYRNNISSYERGEREPPLHALLKYAQAAGVWVDVLIDDELDLPEKLPSPTKHEGIKRVSAARGKKR
jgi:transcriptional regulator with XRE-family HTH domain